LQKSHFERLKLLQILHTTFLWGVSWTITKLILSSMCLVGMAIIDC
jgi:hypothetical protein